MFWKCEILVEGYVDFNGKKKNFEQKKIEFLTGRKWSDCRVFVRFSIFYSKYDMPGYRILKQKSRLS